MVFSSPFFLFLFLPLALGIYFIVPDRWKNTWLLFVSLVFYLVGAGIYLAVLLFSIGTNFWFGRRIEGSRGTARQRGWLFAAIVVNLVPLLAYKYGSFIAETFNQDMALIGWEGRLPVPDFFLPAGISFFTFQGLAYVIDVRRGVVTASRSLVKFALFKSFFPQLIAGPIVRYQELATDLDHRRHTLDQVALGLERFGFGLAKKILIADTLGRIADKVFNASPGEWSSGNAWLGLACYTLQIFFDFSGYSDMAIGLGRMCGLSLPENFLQPYRATSVTDFWRRWHLTLSRFFRDYIYIPLGGNRRGRARTALNLLVVFALCGLWHGAHFTFLVWGLFHGALLAAERLLKGKFGYEPSGWPGRIYALLAVMGGWVFFRSETLARARLYFRALVGRNPSDPLFTPIHFLTPNVMFFLTMGAVIALWPESAHPRAAADRRGAGLGWRPWLAVALTAWAMVAQSPQSFNPFIYFQF